MQNHILSSNEWGNMPAWILHSAVSAELCTRDKTFLIHKRPVFVTDTNISKMHNWAIPFLKTKHLRQSFLPCLSIFFVKKPNPLIKTNLKKGDYEHSSIAFLFDINRLLHYSAALQVSLVVLYIIFILCTGMHITYPIVAQDV